MSFMKRQIVCRQSNAAFGVGIRKLALSAALGSSASPADVPSDSEGQDWIIQDKDLLRKSLTESGTGLHVLDLINRASLEADRTLYSKLLNKCSQMCQLKQTTIVHAHILTSQFNNDLPILNTLLNTYVKCGSLDDAHHLFDEMPHRDLVTWTSLISGYS
ncbi:hypothetical protein ACLB2K_027580 [Fragaria x ananassa]